MITESRPEPAPQWFRDIMIKYQDLLDRNRRLAAENAALRRRLVEAGATDPSEEWARDDD